jgi:flavodoxin
MRTLVVYFSRSGNTRMVATDLARALGADMEEIVERTSRDGIVGYARSLYESIRKHAAEIAPAVKGPEGYDLVVIGTPVWGGDVSSPVRAYLERNRSKLPAVAFFCTMGGRGSEGAFRTMEQLAGKPPKERLALNQPRVAALRSIDTFVARVAPVTPGDATRHDEPPLSAAAE